MAARPPKPAQYPWLMPYITVRDVRHAMDFYEKAFGFEACPNPVTTPDGKIMHGEMKHKDAVMMFGPESAKCPTKAPVTTSVSSPIGCYLYCDDVNALHQRATAAGAECVVPPTDMFWGDRMASYRDPDGHVWSFATNVADFDPTKIPPMEG